MQYLGGILADRPYQTDPVHIIKTTRGVMFVAEGPTPGSSTCPIYAKIWSDDTSAFITDFEMARLENDWNINPEFGVVTIDPPRRKDGKPGRAWVEPTHDGFFVRAERKDGTHYDTANRSILSGPSMGHLRGDLVYWLRWAGSNVELEMPGKPSQGGGSSDSGEGGLKGFIRRLLEWIKNLF
jgi:hypothetical protein